MVRVSHHSVCTTFCSVQLIGSKIVAMEEISSQVVWPFPPPPPLPLGCESGVITAFNRGASIVVCMF